MPVHFLAGGIRVEQYFPGEVGSGATPGASTSTGWVGEGADYYWKAGPWVQGDPQLMLNQPGPMASHVAYIDDGSGSAFYDTTPGDDWRVAQLFIAFSSGSITGTLSATLSDVTLSATAQLKIAGTLSATLANATLAAIGQLKIAGTLAATLGDTTLSSTGQLKIAGSLNATLGDVTLAGLGVIKINGTVNVTLGDVTLAATGQGPQINQGPRGAWISDERVNRSRDRGWKKKKEAEQDLREALDELLTGKPSRATLALRAAQNNLELAMLLDGPMVDPALLALRAEVAALQGRILREKNLRALIQRMQIMEELDAQEEAGIVALLMSVN